MFVGQLFEPADIALRQVVRGSLIRWIAIVDAAPQRPAVARCTVPERILPWACVALIQRPDRLGCAFQQQLGLECRDEESVPIFLETAAAPAQLTDRPERSNFGVELVV